jgi:alcohol dehydrogenase YqhD (iron-dependent ADH family)
MIGVQPNPTISKVREAIAIIRNKENNIQAVLAVGGGSVIDSAKAVCAGALIDEDIYEIYEKQRKNHVIPSPNLPLYTILTLSAAASEFSRDSVLSDPSKKEKINAVLHFPVASAVDPTVC